MPCKKVRVLNVCEKSIQRDEKNPGLRYAHKKTNFCKRFLGNYLFQNKNRLRLEKFKTFLGQLQKFLLWP